MENLKRYGPTVTENGFGTMQQLDNGGWVKFADIKELLQTDAQQPQPEMCLGCEYWRMPSCGHCMRGEGVEFCFKVGTHAGVR